MSSVRRNPQESRGRPGPQSMGLPPTASGRRMGQADDLDGRRVASALLGPFSAEDGDPMGWALKLPEGSGAGRPRGTAGTVVFSRLSPSPRNTRASRRLRAVRGSEQSHGCRSGAMGSRSAHPQSRSSKPRAAPARVRRKSPPRIFHARILLGQNPRTGTTVSYTISPARTRAGKGAQGC